MASNYKTAVAARNDAADAIADRLNSGTIPIRTGAPETNVSDASGGTLLGTPLFGATAFGSPSGGTKTANAITSDSSADASGDAGHFRMYANGAGDTSAESQGTAGESGDTPDMTFDNKTIVSGGVIAITSLTITVPEQ